MLVSKAFKRSCSSVLAEALSSINTASERLARRLADDGGAGLLFLVSFPEFCHAEAGPRACRQSRVVHFLR